MGLIRKILDIIRNRPPSTQPPVQSPSTPIDTNSLQQSLLDAHNQERDANGLPKLRLNLQLFLAAQQHAQWMSDAKTMSHTGANGSDPGARISAEGYHAQAWGENIAEGYQSVAAVMDGWMLSRGHRHNILSLNYIEVGFGMVNYYWCADFGAPTGNALPGAVGQSLSGPLKYSDTN